MLAIAINDVELGLWDPGTEPSLGMCSLREGRGTVGIC